jgi:hypothetical protein
MEPRTLRALIFMAGVGIVALGLSPIGDIETPWPPYTLQAWAWMEPFVWPFFVIGSIFIAGALLENVRPHIPASAVLLGGISTVLFLGTLVAGRKALYDLWFPDQLGPAGMLEFHFWLLAVHFSVMLLIMFGGMAEVGRRWRTDHPASQSS